MTRPVPRPVRSQTVDLLRGVAILLVLLLHYQIAYRLDQTSFGPGIYSTVIKHIAWNGNYGVTIFFVISGFLITSNARRRYGRLGSLSPRSFYVMRLARIAPCLLLMLVVVVLLSQTSLDIFQQHSSKTTLSMAVFSVATFWHNVLMARAGYFNYCLNILWSLSVEEMFYLTFPLLWLCLRRETWVFCVWAGLIVVGPIYRSLHASDEIVAFYAYLSCFDAISIGCLTAFFAPKMPLSRRRIVLLASVLLISATYLAGGIMDHVVFGFSLVALGTAGVLVASAGQGETLIPQSNGVARGLCWFGRHSYELYLFHVVILGLMRSLYTREQIAPEYKIPWFFVFLTSSALVAWVVARFYAEPLNRWLRLKLMNPAPAPVDPVDMASENI